MTNWYKIALFCLLSFLLGWFVGRHLCGGHHGGCHEGGMCHEGGCEQGGKDCCKGEGHGDMHGEHMSGGKCCVEGEEGGREEKIHAIIHGIKDSNFQGDTTVKIEDGSVHISRHGDKMEVKV